MSTELAGATEPGERMAESSNAGEFAARWNELPEGHREAAHGWIMRDRRAVLRIHEILDRFVTREDWGDGEAPTIIVRDHMYLEGDFFDDLFAALEGEVRL